MLTRLIFLAGFRVSRDFANVISLPNVLTNAMDGDSHSDRLLLAIIIYPYLLDPGGPTSRVGQHLW